MVFFSYLAAAIAYLFFLCLILAAGIKTRQGKLLFIASSVSLFWALHVVLYYELNWLSLSDYILFDTLRALSWLIFLLALPIEKTSLFTNKTFWLAIVLALSINIHHIYIALTHTESSLSGIYLSLALIVLLFTLLERCYRLLQGENKWQIKPLCIYLAIVYSCDFYMYAQAALLGSQDYNIWMARGFIHCLALPLLLLATKRTTMWSVRIYVSRDVVFHSSMLLFAGSYLMLMAFSGYYIKYIGGQWGNLLQFAFIAFAVVMLVTVFLSERFRQKVKVFIAKHFFANRYEYRDEWLSVTDSLLEKDKDTPPFEHALNTILSRLRCQTGYLLAEDDTGNLTLVTGKNNKQNFKPEYVEPLLPFLKKQSWIIDLDEFRNNPQHYKELVMAPELLHNTNIWLIVPIFYKDKLISILLLGHSLKLAGLQWEERDYINVMVRQLAHYLLLHKANLALTEAKQFEAFNQMSAFLVHDLKNTLAQLSLIVTNAQKYKDNPEFIDDSIDTLANVVTRMRKVLDHFKRNKPQASEVSAININQLIESVCLDRSQSQPKPTFKCTSAKVTLYADRDKLTSVLFHLIQNAQDATEDSGFVNVELSTAPSWVEIKVSDNGTGMDESFIRERLFSPFDTTKGNAGMGIGVYEARQYAQKMGGRLNVSSQKSKGSCFTLNLPLKKSDPSVPLTGKEQEVV